MWCWVLPWVCSCTLAKVPKPCTCIRRLWMYHHCVLTCWQAPWARWTHTLPPIRERRPTSQSPNRTRRPTCQRTAGTRTGTTTSTSVSSSNDTCRAVLWGEPARDSQWWSVLTAHDVSCDSARFWRYFVESFTRFYLRGSFYGDILLARSVPQTANDWSCVGSRSALFCRLRTILFHVWFSLVYIVLAGNA